MHPRLKTSLKWTPLPKDFLAQIRTVFKESFAKQLGKDSVECDGRIYPEEIMVSVGVREEKRLKQSNFEVSVAYKKDKDNVLKLLHTAVDAAASLFEQYFAAEDDSDFPRTWTEFEVDGRKIFAQYTTTNSSLESEANKILGEFADEGLAGGSWEDDVTSDEVKAKLGIDPEDELDAAMAEDLEDDTFPIGGEDGGPKKKPKH